MNKIKSGLFFVPLLFVIIPLGIASGDAPLLQLSDLKYQGAFRLPGGNNLGGPKMSTASDMEALPWRIIRRGILFT